MLWPYRVSETAKMAISFIDLSPANRSFVLQWSAMPYRYCTSLFTISTFQGKRELTPCAFPILPILCLILFKGYLLCIITVFWR
jgi:hypothetical protein